ncbi:MAG: SH3 domain-containing protein [Anaerolineales bacterium]|nr:SH3 domain-containing protein [Anaerolineales bacterium]
MAQTGKTTGNLKLRSGPGMEFEPPLAFLEPGTELEVLGAQGDWLHVKVAGKEGYVGKKYVEVFDSAPAAPAPAPAAPAPAATHVPPEPDDSGMTKHDPRPGLARGSAPTGKAHKGVEDQ